MTSTRTLYDCRRSFRTIAGEVCDLEAVNFCMGHERPAGAGSAVPIGVRAASMGVGVSRQLTDIDGNRDWSEIT